MHVSTERFLPGEELKTSLQQYVATQGLEAAFIITCVGSVSKATLRFSTQQSGPGSEKEVTYRKEYFDILSLVGTVSQGGAHLHVVLGRADGTVVGGHLVGNAKIHTTAEVVIGESLAEVYIRKNDPNTTFNELEIKPRSR
ncbi:bifunctional protein GlmU-like isoform X3 [Macrosteles quadrilineatus]|uniref:bifunctional protein GlmU-like isoform X3 n=1 Tax=Macrosteles quadrilineatus TaxID=74068 RepID=UPI0023E1C63D|nr:bifunctional protein GlmU-like isoform X3 [Macrosteles quadrilineatus]